MTSKARFFPERFYVERSIYLIKYVLRFLKSSFILDTIFLKGCFPKMRRKIFIYFPSLAFSANLFIRSDNGAFASIFSIAFSAFLMPLVFSFCVPMVISLMNFSAVLKLESWWFSYKSINFGNNTFRCFFSINHCLLLFRCLILSGIAFLVI